jgi:hypothetical protein
VASCSLKYTMAIFPGCVSLSFEFFKCTLSILFLITW